MNFAHRSATAFVAAALLAGGALGALAAPAGATSAQLTQARKMLLVLGDMPSGWTKSKHTNNGNNNVGAQQLARCIGVASALISENPPSVNSPEFQDKQGVLTVDDNVTVFPSAKNAAAEYATVINPKTPSCMTALASGPLKAKLFGKTPKGTTYGTPLVSATEPGAFGPTAGGFSLSVPVSTHGVTVNVTVTQLFSVKGRLGQQVTFTSIGVPFSIPLEQHLTSVAVGRL
jgi:hypothetical protein